MTAAPARAAVPCTFEPGARLNRMRTREQFQAALSQRPVARTSHFALHRLPAPVLHEGFGPCPGLADESAVWIGAMTPKRWARRSVTRNGIRRQIYSVAHDRAACLAPGAHLVRLRSAFAVAQFPSATSRALLRAVRAELLELFGSGTRNPQKPEAAAS